MPKAIQISVLIILSASACSKKNDGTTRNKPCAASELTTPPLQEKGFVINQATNQCEEINNSDAHRSIPYDRTCLALESNYIPGVSGPILIPNDCVNYACCDAAAGFFYDAGKNKCLNETGKISDTKHDCAWSSGFLSKYKDENLEKMKTLFASSRMNTSSGPMYVYGVAISSLESEKTFKTAVKKESGSLLMQYLSDQNVYVDSSGGKVFAAWGSNNEISITYFSCKNQGTSVQQCFDTTLNLVTGPFLDKRKPVILVQQD